MPHTTLVASSWAITLPPAATMSAAPLRAVRAHAGEDERKAAGAPHLRRRGEQRIDRRLAKIDRRVVAERDRGPVAAARRRAYAGRPARHRCRQAAIGSSCSASCTRAPADARQMFGQHRRESRRHVLGDQNRRTLDRGADLPDQRRERLRSAGRGADQQTRAARDTANGRRANGGAFGRRPATRRRAATAA